MWPGGGRSSVTEAPLPAVGSFSTGAYELLGDRYIFTVAWNFLRVRSLVVTLGADIEGEKDGEGDDYEV